MRFAGLNSRPRRRFRPQSLTDSNHDLPVALNRLCDLAAPQQLGRGLGGGHHLCGNRRGLAVCGRRFGPLHPPLRGLGHGDSLATTLPLAALDMALKQRRPTGGLVHHSDRVYGMPVPLIGNGWRAPESFQHEPSRQLLRQRRHGKLLSSLKRELVYRCQFATRAQARAAIFEWIEVFTNRERLHSALGFKSPVDFETNLN